jgi:hypothetical protein
VVVEVLMMAIPINDVERVLDRRLGEEWCPTLVLMLWGGHGLYQPLRLMLSERRAARIVLTAS